jgi:hypothetical protein
MKYCLYALSLVLINNVAVAQVARYTDINRIGWLSVNCEMTLSPRWDIALDCQVRRDELGLKSQQYLYRAGLNYRLNQKASVLLGYAFIETYAYGDADYPISASKVNFPENRIYQQLQLKDKIGVVDIIHRYRLEQRWLAIQNKEYSHTIDEWRRTNRFRYLLRFQVPFKGNTTDEKEGYFACYNEIFVSFGSKVKYNLFDQNRSALLFGYKFSNSFKLEAGPFSQILQLGNLQNVPGLSPNKTVMQYNLGYLVSASFNFNPGKKTP